MLRRRLSRVLSGEFKMLRPFKDGNGVIRVGGREDKALVSYETKHPILLPNKHWISYLITRHMYQFSHCGKAATEQLRQNRSFLFYMCMTWQRRSSFDVCFAEKWN